MNKSVLINNKINKFDKKIEVSSDKSISIRCVLMASQAIGCSKIYNLLESEDVISAINAIKSLGIKVIKKKKYYEILGKGLNNFSTKNNRVIKANNSGTLSRLILGMLVKFEKKIIITGDRSLKKRDFQRVILPLSNFGAKIISKNKKLPITIKGTRFVRPIEFFEKKGSAQVKSSIMLAALNTPGITKIKSIKSRDHTEKLFKYLNIPINIKSNKKFDEIKVRGLSPYNSFNYKIPGDISSSAFFIVLTLLSKNSKIVIKNVNINKTRTGIIQILNKMNAGIKIKNKKIYKGEEIGDIIVKSRENLKSINCPKYFNSSAIDEFLLIFLVSAKSKGISHFKGISELRHKESDRLKIASNLLRMIGIKIYEKKDSLKIYGNPNLELNKNIRISNFMKDHRVFMLSCIAALTLGGRWKIDDFESIKTSFPNFLFILKKLGAKINYEKKN
jgi:3-phosphoshikimate 1-carboxyvinyltransferase